MNQTVQTQAPVAGYSGSYIEQEYETRQGLLAAQPASVRRRLDFEARSLAEAILQRAPDVRFVLPQAVVPAGGAELVVVAERRAQHVGSLIERVGGTRLGEAVRQRFLELEQDDDPGMRVAAGLLRHATAVHMVHNMLPAGRSVTYTPDEGDEIPSIPTPGVDGVSALTATSDAIVEQEPGTADDRTLVAPYVPAARRFYLPRWVAFDDLDRLLVGSTEEAEALVGALQRFIEILHAAVALAPYMVASQEYRSKRYGALGQLVNQGRALARYETGQVIEIIRARAAAHALNRGLSVSLPYFDDQALAPKTYPLEIIPAGRVPFLPAFVVRRTREAQAKVAQDTRLNYSTRRHLLAEMRMLERAFSTSAAFQRARS